MKATHALLSLVVATLLAFSFYSTASAAEYEINFQSIYPPQHPLHKNYYQPAFQAIEKESGGRLLIHFFPNAGLVSEIDVMTSIMNGSLDMGGARIVYNESIIPHTLAMEVPHISSDTVQGSKLYWKLYQNLPEVKTELDKVGKIITVWASDRSALFSTKGPINSPADLKGKKILIWNGGQVDQVKAWGGIPVQSTINESYLALQRGVGDIVYAPVPAGVSCKFLELSKDITVLPANTMVLILAMNQDLWNDLPPDLQQIIMDNLGGEKASQASGSLLYDGTQEYIKIMENAGCKFTYLTPDQYQTFKDADKEVTTKFLIDNLTRLGVDKPSEWIQKIRAESALIPPHK